MKTFEYRMGPNKKQEQALMSVLIASRKMYNACLEELITHYQETGKYLHLYEQDKRHGKAAHPDLPAVVVDTTLKRLHRSFTNFFQGRKAGRKVGFPRFKGVNAWNTIQFRDAANCLDNGRFKAPAICGGRIRVFATSLLIETKMQPGISYEQGCSCRPGRAFVERARGAWANG